MKFFVPGYTDQKQALVAWENARKERETTHGPITEKKIFKIFYSRNSQQVTEQVGEPSPLVGESILAIMESTSVGRAPLYLILTGKQTRMVGGDRGPSIEFFEALE